VLTTVTYANARAELFPHVYPDQVNSPWPWKRKRLYICDECLAAEKKWLGQQPGANQSTGANAGGRCRLTSPTLSAARIAQFARYVEGGFDVCSP
jgi:hypothetical protein